MLTFQGAYKTTNPPADIHCRLDTGAIGRFTGSSTTGLALLLLVHEPLWAKHHRFGTSNPEKNKQKKNRGNKLIINSPKTGFRKAPKFVPLTLISALGAAAHHRGSSQGHQGSAREHLNEMLSSLHIKDLHLEDVRYTYTCIYIYIYIGVNIHYYLMIHMFPHIYIYIYTASLCKARS